MKRAKKGWAVFLTAALLCIVLAACGDSTSEDDPVIGTWEMSSVSVQGQSYTTEEFLKMVNYTDGDMPTITFKSDHTVKLEFMGHNGTSTWEQNDGTYRVTDESGGASMDFSLEKEQLSIEQSGATLIFEKKKEE